MAEKIPQLEETQPILQAQGVASGAEGYEAFAKTLGGLAKNAAEQVETIEADKSNSMYLASQANVDDLKLSTQELIAKDPAHANDFIKTFKQSVEEVGSIAYVNKSDKKTPRIYSANIESS